MTGVLLEVLVSRIRKKKLTEKEQEKENNMGAFSQIRNAKGSGSGLYLTEGQHDLEILAVKQRQGWNGTSFIVEFKILESTTMPTGSRPSYVVKLDPKDPVKLDLQLTDIKEFIAAATGMNPGEVDEPDVEEATSAANPLAGTRIKAISQNRPTKKPGAFFTKHSWISCEPSQEVAAP